MANLSLVTISVLLAVQSLPVWQGGTSEGILTSAFMPLKQSTQNTELKAGELYFVDNFSYSGLYWMPFGDLAGISFLYGRENYSELLPSLDHPSVCIKPQ